MESGYIYIRNHISYDFYDACKLGKTSNIPERDSNYITCEINRGSFHPIFEVSLKQISIIEDILKYRFQEYNIKNNAGTEFFNKKIINLIEPCFQELDIKYKKLTKDEIDKLVRPNRIKENSCNLVLRDYQKYTTNKALLYFDRYDKGLLLLMCGVGKTLISLWITQKLNYNTILIGVPNILLLKQWKKVISIIFPNIPILLISGNINEDHIVNFLNDKCIIITTYASSYKVYNVTKEIDFNFDMKILDECHHLTSKNIDEDKKSYIKILNISSKKQLSLTATQKQLESEKEVISNDNIKYFGNIIDKKSLLWSINNNIICDYIIQTIITDEDNFDTFKVPDKLLFFSAFSSLKSINDNNTHHLLIYCNNKENSLKILEYIKMLIDDKYFDIPDIYYSNYHSEMNNKDQKNILNSFEKAKYGIIICVYCLGEGWEAQDSLNLGLTSTLLMDFPLLDGVVFAENMSSNIRIVQSALRASRKNMNDKNKITKIILPILKFEDSNDLKKIKEVVYQLGLEDDMIIEKVKVLKVDIDKQEPKEKEDTKKEYDYDSELTNKLKLLSINRLSLNITYEKAKEILATKNIKSKKDYYKLCDIDLRFSKEPDIIFKGYFKDWIDYLGIDKVYYDFGTCKRKISEYLIKYSELNKHFIELTFICEKLCEIDNSFPPSDLWINYYNISHLKDIIQIYNDDKLVFF